MMFNQNLSVISNSFSEISIFFFVHCDRIGQISTTSTELHVATHAAHSHITSHAHFLLQLIKETPNWNCGFHQFM